MSSDIDERVVEMKFNSSQFDTGVKKTLGVLDTLKSALKLDGAKKGLNDLDAAGKKFSLANIAQGVENISSKFTALGVIGVTALASIATKALDAGAQLVKSITLDPIMQGFQEYETQINAIQTILANTASQGTNLKQVNAALAELNTYADKTIYNFTEMTRNIGTFTAAGVSLKTSTEAIKGISNLAAVSGSNAQQASTAMYQLSQALASGTVKLQDWNSVVNAGMGGQVFQDALKETARMHGIKIDEMIKKEGSFRETLKNGWLTSKVLTETLAKFTGDLNEEQLKGMGYSKKQIADIIKLGKTANDAATKVKTFSQLIDTLKEAVGSGWAQTWQTVFGDFDEAKKMYTEVSNVLGGLIGASSDSRNQILKDWKALGGRTVIIGAISDMFEQFMRVAKHVGKAFKEIFPPKTGQDLYNLTVRFRSFIAYLTLSSDQVKKIKTIFKGVFALFSIVGQILGRVFGLIGDLVGELFKGGDGFLDFAAGIAEWVIALDKAMKDGQGLTKFFEGLKTAIMVPLGILKAFAQLIKDAFSGDAGNGLGSFVQNVQNSFQPLKVLGDVISAAWLGMIDAVKKSFGFMAPVIDAISRAFAWLSQKVSDAMSKMTLPDLGKIFNMAILGVILFKIKGFVSGLKGAVDTGKGFLDGFKEIFDGVTGCLEAMQQNLKAGTLLKIAGALALMTASIVALSFIDAGDLAKSVLALQVMFIQLNVAMTMFTKVANNKGFLKMPLVASTLILLGVAINILAAAVARLSKLKWEEIAKGLVGVGGLLVALGLFTKFVTVTKFNPIQAAGLMYLALAINVLAKAVETFGKMEVGTIVKGLGAVTIALGVLAGFSRVTGDGKGIIAISTSLILLSVGMKILASAMGDFAKMSWEDLAKGFAAFAAALLIVAGAMQIMPKNMIVNAVALVVVAGALTIIGEAVQKMAKMSWEEIARGMVVLAGALIIIALGTLAMTSALPGAAAMLVVAASLAILAPILQAFGKMSWEEIGKAMVVLAGAFLILGLAGLALTPVIPSLLGLGAAILLIGVGVAAAGAGLLMFATGLTALSVAGAAGAAGLTIAIIAIANLIPLIIQKVGEGIIALIKTIAGSIGEVIQAFVTILLGIIKAVVIVIPALVKAAVTLVRTLVSALVKNLPWLIQAGFKLLIGFLEGIRKNITKVVNTATDIVVAFIRAVGKNSGKVLEAGADMILDFIRGLTRTINKKSGEMRQAGADLARAIINGMTGGLADGAWKVIQAAAGVARDALNAAMKALGINSPSKEFYKLGQYSDEGLALGFTAKSYLAENAGKRVAQNAIEAMKEALSPVQNLDYSFMDTQPTITPVLDLSQAKKDANMLSGLLQDQKPISVDKAYATASSISAEQAAVAEQATQVVTEPVAPIHIEMNQTNTSPQALSTVDIWRNTRNQISQLKGALSA